MSYQINDEHLKSLKQSFAKSGINYKSDNDYLAASQNLNGLIDILLKIDNDPKSNLDADTDKVERYVLYDKDGNKIIL